MEMRKPHNHIFTKVVLLFLFSLALFQPYCPIQSFKHNNRHHIKYVPICSSKIPVFLRKNDKFIFSRSKFRLDETVPDQSEKDAVPSTQNKAFIFGLGYVGAALALKLAADGWEVAGTTTDVNMKMFLQKKGIGAFLFNEWLDPALQDQDKQALLQATHILSTVPPSTMSGKDPVLIAHSRTLEMAASELGSCRWLGYLSSTGVYGDRAGQWVTESDRPQPISPKTRARRDAERAWQFMQERKGLPVHLFRLAGIYGPSRSALDTLTKAGGDMANCNPDDEAYISRVHISDIIQLLECSMAIPEPGLVVNVADDQPSTRYEVLSFACKLLDLPISAASPLPPAFDRWLDSGNTPFITRSGGSKRVDNGRMKTLLSKHGKKLIHQDYRSGLLALNNKDFAPFTEDVLNILLAPKPSAVTEKLQSTIQQDTQSGLPEQDMYATKQELSELKQEVQELKVALNLLLKKMGDLS